MSQALRSQLNTEANTYIRLIQWQLYLGIGQRQFPQHKNI